MYLLQSEAKMILGYFNRVIRELLERKPFTGIVVDKQRESKNFLFLVVETEWGYLDLYFRGDVDGLQEFELNQRVNGVIQRKLFSVPYQRSESDRLHYRTLSIEPEQKRKLYK